MVTATQRFIRRRWPVLAVTVVAVIGVITYFVWRAVTPQTPSDFYTPPQALAQEIAAVPGSLVRSEKITDALPEGAVGWRILYTSVGVDGEPIVVSGVVAAPEGASSAPRPVLAFAQGTIGNLPVCGIGHTRTPFAGIPEIDTMIAEGYVVVSTDYPGRGTSGVHPYLIGEVAAASVLDAVRAARQLDANASESFVVWGRSQGGHSSMWTAQLAAQYAPELNLVAVAASAPAIDLEGILTYSMDKARGAVVFTYAVAAWSQMFADINLDELIVPDRRQQFDRIASTCVTTPAAFLLLGELSPPSEYLAVDILKLESVKALMEQNTPRLPISVPLLIAHGTSDTLIPIEGSDAEFARRCAAGEDVQFVRYPGVDHDAADASALMIIGWLSDRLEGRTNGSNCDGTES